MKVLVIKTSSMGDIIHTLPALTDAMHAIPTIQFDWIVEETFAALPSRHPAVHQVIPVALRRWRKQLFSSTTWKEWRAAYKQWNAYPYDIILDAQGLVKSAWLAFFAKGTRMGLDFRSAREGLASLAYQQRFAIYFYQHAVTRMRQLFSQALHYPLPDTVADYQLQGETFAPLVKETAYLVFLHGTTWASKQWPENYWITLAQIAARAGYQIKIGGGNAEEVARAERIAAACSEVEVMPYLDIVSMARCLAHAKGVVAVDTGFGHLAAALNVPIVSLYGSTCADYTGALGATSLLLSADFKCSPCFNRNCTYRDAAIVSPACYASLTPAKVWEALNSLLQKDNNVQGLY